MKGRVAVRPQLYLSKAAMADLITARQFETVKTTVSKRQTGRPVDSATSAVSNSRRFNPVGKRGGSTPDPVLAAAVLEGAEQGISRRSIEAAFARRRAGRVVVDRRRLKAEIREARGTGAPAVDADEQLSMIRAQLAEHRAVLSRLCTEGLINPAQRSTMTANVGKHAKEVKEICRTVAMKLSRRVVGGSGTALGRLNAEKDGTR